MQAYISLIRDNLSFYSYQWHFQSIFPPSYVAVVSCGDSVVELAWVVGGTSDIDIVLFIINCTHCYMFVMLVVLTLEKEEK